jgi:hypothetical protein
MPDSKPSTFKSSLVLLGDLWRAGAFSGCHPDAIRAVVAAVQSEGTETDGARRARYLRQRGRALERCERITERLRGELHPSDRRVCRLRASHTGPCEYGGGK